MKALRTKWPMRMVYRTTVSVTETPTSKLTRPRQLSVTVSVPIRIRYTTVRSQASAAVTPTVRRFTSSDTFLVPFTILRNDFVVCH